MRPECKGNESLIIRFWAHIIIPRHRTALLQDLNHFAGFKSLEQLYYRTWLHRWRLSIGLHFSVCLLPLNGFCYLDLNWFWCFVQQICVYWKLVGSSTLPTRMYLKMLQWRSLAATHYYYTFDWLEWLLLVDYMQCGICLQQLISFKTTNKRMCYVSIINVG